jgi:acyl-homoserine-lactone acylase
VFGAALYGLPVVAIGHNARVAWSHTVSTAQRFTPFALRLVPGKPTSYLLDGRKVPMRRQQVTVDVLGAAGRTERRRHTFYRTRFGPVLTLPGLFEWTAESAYALRDANADNLRLIDTWLDMGRAGSTHDLVRSLGAHQGMPFVNTIAADSAGEALYADLSVVPHVTDEHARRCVTSALGRELFATIGLPVLDGSTTACDWGTDRDAVGPGIFGPSRQPVLFRPDFVTNSNDSHWLSNPAQPLTGFPRIIGDERTERSLRTRLGIRMVQQRLAGSDGLPGTRFTLERLQQVMFNNRNYGGELVRDDLVALCEANPTVRLADGAEVDLRPACAVLARWDLRDDLESVGAHIFREFMMRRPSDWLAVPFDPEDPVNTPHTLNRTNPGVLQALGEAVRLLQGAGIPLDARLGSIQSEPRGDERIPVHGGDEIEGVFNMIIAPFQGPAGYPKVVHGSSFVMVAGFTDAGPESRAILTYSQSTDPTSPFFADQTRLFSRKDWVPMRFTESDILSDPELRAYTVESPIWRVTSVTSHGW